MATVPVAGGDVAVAAAGRLSIPIPGSPRKLNRPSHHLRGGDVVDKPDKPFFSQSAPGLVSRMLKGKSVEPGGALAKRIGAAQRGETLTGRPGTGGEGSESAVFGSTALPWCVGCTHPHSSVRDGGIS
jgi:hypothetical protein